MRHRTTKPGDTVTVPQFVPRSCWRRGGSLPPSRQTMAMLPQRRFESVRQSPSNQRAGGGSRWRRTQPDGRTYAKGKNSMYISRRTRRDGVRNIPCHQRVRRFSYPITFGFVGEHPSNVDYYYGEARLWLPGRREVAIVFVRAPAARSAGSDVPAGDDCRCSQRQSPG